jgi:hypothetical protein
MDGWTDRQRDMKEHADGHMDGWTDRQTDMKELAINFCNFGNACKNRA